LGRRGEAEDGGGAAVTREDAGVFRRRWGSDTDA
jgi:hypothetical protein